MMGRWGWLWGAGLLVGLGLPGVAVLAEPGAAGRSPGRNQSLQSIVMLWSC